MGVIVKDGIVYKEFEDGVYVSETGDVISVRPLAIGDNGSGYKHFSVHRGGISTRYYVHRAVAEMFHKNPENKPQVDHIDGNKANNWASNLQWISPEDNVRKYFAGDYVAISPEGERFSFINIRVFCEERGLDSSSLCKVLKGKAKQHKGWTAEKNK